MNRCLRPCSLAVLMLSCIALAGCGGSSLTSANYDKMKDGMSLKEAEAVLGPGTAIKSSDIDKMSMPVGAMIPFGIISSDGKQNKTIDWVRWGDEKKFILLGLLDEKVKYKFKNGL